MNVGDRVRTGQPLVRLDAADARLAVAEAEAALLEARVQYLVLVQNEPLRSAPVPLDSLRAASRDAFVRGDLTEAEWADAQRRLDTRAAVASGTRDDVRAVTSGLTRAEQRLEHARLALERTTLRAPFSGRVEAVHTEVGEHLGAGQAGVTLLDDTRMRVEVDVLEEVAARLRPGRTAAVHLPALDRTVRARLAAVHPAIHPETGMGRAVLALDNPGDLLAGLHAEVTLDTESPAERLVVPEEAVLYRQDRTLVFRLDAGRAMWTYVDVGERFDDRIEIRSGIEAGDTVLVSGHATLAHQAAVRVTDDAPVP